jgi:tetratricopeptide (TPR) repeat protein
VKAYAPKYNPAFQIDEDLIAAFVVRKRDLDLVLEIVRANTALLANQHVLVVGPRGFGKTTLVRRVAAELRTNPSLKRDWFPLIFAEESYAVSTAGEFWLESVFRIFNQTQDLKWKAAYDELRKEADEARLRDAALAHLLDFSDEIKKKIVLIVENVNMLLGQMAIYADWEIRHTLLNEARLMLLGTATSRFSEIESVDKAWFELFSLHELKPLATVDCVQLWQSLTGNKIPRAQAKALRILTGGNPRLLRVLADFAANKSFRELMQDLTRLVDEHTEYFKNQLDNLGPLERRVFVAVLELWDPSETNKIAAAARLDVSKTSVYLSRLMEKGCVVLQENGRRRRYQTAERLYNIYYLMRRHGHPSDRVKAVVRFMVQFYEDQGLIDTITNLAKEACALGPHFRQDHYLAYEEIIRCGLGHDLASRILASTPPQFFSNEDTPAPVKELARMLLSHSREVPTFTEANSRKDKNSAEYWIRRGVALQKRGNTNSAEKAFRRAVELAPDDSRPWVHLGAALSENPSRAKEAEAVLRKAVELDTDSPSAWAELANLLHDLEKYEESAGASRRVADLSEGGARANALGILGHTLALHLRRHAEAEAVLAEAIALEPKDGYNHAILGKNYLLQSKTDEAKKCFLRALKLEFKRSGFLSSLTDELHRLGLFAAAEEAARRAISMDPKTAYNWRQLAELTFYHTHKETETEDAIRKAIELQPDDASAYRQLAVVLRWNGRLEEAEKAIGRSIEREPESAASLTELGIVMTRQGRFEEASKALVKSVEIRPEDSYTWSRLGDAYGGVGNFTAAREAYEKATTLPDCDEKNWADLLRFEIVRGSPVEAVSRTVNATLANSVSPQRLRSIAKEICRTRSDFYSAFVLATRQALDTPSSNHQARGLLALLFIEKGSWSDAALELSKLMVAAIDDSAALGTATSLLIMAAANSPQSVLDLIKQSPAATAFEPLTVGVRISLGESPVVAKEIHDIGKDVARQINFYRQSAAAAETTEGESFPLVHEENSD